MAHSFGTISLLSYPLMPWILSPPGHQQLSHFDCIGQRLADYVNREKQLTESEKKFTSASVSAYVCVYRADVIRVVTF